MKRGIEAWPDYDPTGTWVLKVKKKRGRLTLDEIQEAAMEYDQDFYMLVIRAMDDNLDQYFNTDDLEGDFVTLYRADDFFKWRERDGND